VSEIATVDVWYLPLAADAEAERAAFSMLTAGEQRAVERFREADDRAARTRARALLRTVLARVQDCDPRAVAIVETSDGRPVLEDPTAPRFSVAHSRALAVVGVSPTHELGVDVEPRRDFAWREVADRFFAPAEVAAVESHPVPLDAFFAIWVRKEAYLKGLGSGFTEVSDRFEVPLDDGFVRDPTRAPAAWYLHGLDLDASHAAALAVAGGPATVAVQDGRGLAAR
jgi:4'-phosphopantetheinyl transferase